MGKYLRIGIPFVFLIFLSNFWNIAGWIYTKGPIALDCLAFFFMVFAFYNRRSVETICKGSPYRKLVNYLCLSPFVMTFVKIIFTGEPFQTEVQASLVMCMTFSMFYYLSKKRITERQCICLMLAFGIITFLLQVYQLNHLDNRLFGFNEEGGSGTRNDMARLAIGAPLHSVFLLYFFWSNLIKAKGVLRLWLFVGFSMFAVSLYLYLTRQYLVAVLVTIVVSVLIQNNMRLKIAAIVLCCVIAIGLYNYYEVLFGDLIYISQHDTYSTDIRQKAYPYFINLIFSDPIRAIIGHGHIASISNIGVTKGLWAIDIGIIGDMYHYGILWGVAYFWMLIKTWKNRKVLPLYIKLYVLSTLIHSPMTSAYVYGPTAFIWTIVIYISMLRTTQSPLVDKTQTT